jgi:hypothetical protein
VCSLITSRRVRALVPAILVLVVGFSCQFAQADLVFTNVYSGTDFAIQASEPVSLVGSLEAVTLRAVGLNGAKPNTFDSDKSGKHGTGITTDTAALHQLWAFNVLPTPTLTNAGYLSSTDRALDTHFLAYDGNLYIPGGLAPSENNVANVGTFLKGTFTDSTAVSSTWDFAYLVVPLGTPIHLDFEIGAPSFSSETVNCSFTVPEPSVFALLATGFIGLVVCRRRFVG